MSKRLGPYTDIREVADLALKHNGGSVEFESRGRAVSWTHRFYKFRKAYAEIYGLQETPYDKLVIPRVPEGETTVIIKIRQTAAFTPAEAAANIQTGDELFDFAKDLAKGVEDD